MNTKNLCKNLFFFYSKTKNRDYQIIELFEKQLYVLRNEDQNIQKQFKTENFQNENNMNFLINPNAYSLQEDQDIQIKKCFQYIDEFTQKIEQNTLDVVFYKKIKKFLRTSELEKQSPKIKNSLKLIQLLDSITKYCFKMHIYNKSTTYYDIEQNVLIPIFIFLISNYQNTSGYLPQQYISILENLFQHIQKTNEVIDIKILIEIYIQSSQLIDQNQNNFISIKLQKLIYYYFKYFYNNIKNFDDNKIQIVIQNQFKIVVATTPDNMTELAHKILNLIYINFLRNNSSYDKEINQTVNMEIMKNFYKYYFQQSYFQNFHEFYQKIEQSNILYIQYIQSKFEKYKSIKFFRYVIYQSIFTKKHNKEQETLQLYLQLAIKILQNTNQYNGIDDLQDIVDFATISESFQENQIFVQSLFNTLIQILQTRQFQQQLKQQEYVYKYQQIFNIIHQNQFTKILHHDQFVQLTTILQQNYPNNLTKCDIYLFKQSIQIVASIKYLPFYFTNRIKQNLQQQEIVLSYVIYQYSRFKATQFRENLENCIVQDIFQGQKNEFQLVQFLEKTIGKTQQVLIQLNNVQETIKEMLESKFKYMAYRDSTDDSYVYIMQKLILILSKIHISKLKQIQDLDLNNKQLLDGYLFLLNFSALTIVSYTIKPFDYIIKGMKYIQNNYSHQLSTQQISLIIKTLNLDAQNGENILNLLDFYMNLFVYRVEIDFNSYVFDTEAFKLLSDQQLFETKSNTLLRLSQFLQNYYFSKFEKIFTYHHLYFKYMFVYEFSQKREDIIIFVQKYNLLINELDKKIYQELIQNFNIFLLHLQTKMVLNNEQYQIVNEIQRSLQKMIQVENEFQHFQIEKTSRAHQDLYNLIKRMRIPVKKEVKTIFGIVDLLIGKDIIIEMNGEIHYKGDQEDLKTKNRIYKAQILGYKLIIVKERQYVYQSNKQQFVKDLFQKHGIIINNILEEKKL